MRLTAKEHPEAIKRYRHLKPAPVVGAGRCAVGFSGTNHACTLRPGHGGPHVAHGRFGRIVAVWDGGASEVPARRGPTHPPAPGRRRRARQAGTGGPIRALRDLVARIMRRSDQYMEEALLLVFFLFMVGFVIDWTLRIMGWK